MFNGTFHFSFVVLECESFCFINRNQSIPPHSQVTSCSPVTHPTVCNPPGGLHLFQEHRGLPLRWGLLYGGSRDPPLTRHRPAPFPGSVLECICPRRLTEYPPCTWVLRAVENTVRNNRDHKVNCCKFPQGKAQVSQAFPLHTRNLYPQVPFLLWEFKIGNFPTS